MLTPCSLTDDAPADGGLCRHDGVILQSLLLLPLTSVVRPRQDSGPTDDKTLQRGSIQPRHEYLRSHCIESGILLVGHGRKRAVDLPRLQSLSTRSTRPGFIASSSLLRTSISLSGDISRTTARVYRERSPATSNVSSLFERTQGQFNTSHGLSRATTDAPLHCPQAATARLLESCVRLTNKD